jgi:hypothetical protein
LELWQQKKLGDIVNYRLTSALPSRPLMKNPLMVSNSIGTMHKPPLPSTKSPVNSNKISVNGINTPPVNGNRSVPDIILGLPPRSPTKSLAVPQQPVPPDMSASVLDKDEFNYRRSSKSANHTSSRYNYDDTLDDAEKEVDQNLDGSHLWEFSNNDASKAVEMLQNAHLDESLDYSLSTAGDVLSRKFPHSIELSSLDLSPTKSVSPSASMSLSPLTFHDGEIAGYSTQSDHNAGFFEQEVNDMLDAGSSSSNSYSTESLSSGSPLSSPVASSISSNDGTLSLGKLDINASMSTVSSSMQRSVERFNSMYGSLRSNNAKVDNGDDIYSGSFDGDEISVDNSFNLIQEAFS